MFGTIHIAEHRKHNEKPAVDYLEINSFSEKDKELGTNK